MEQSIFIRETLLMKRLMTVFYRLPLWRRPLLAAVIIFLMLHFSVTHKAHAQSTLQNDVSSCESGHYVDYLNLGNLNALVLSCAFATNDDTIAIIAKGFSFDSTVPWQQNVNTDNATWIVDTNSDNIANLIIDFSRSPEVRAQLYDDQDGDGEVSFEIVDGAVNVSESNFPTVVVSAKGDSWFTGARLNANLDFQVDGAVNTMASYGRFLDRLSTDGNTDFVIRVRDTDRDNVADYDLRYDTSPLPQHWGLHRVNLMVNESNNGLPLRNYVLWPLLGTSYAEPVRTAAGNLQLVPYNDEFGRRSGLVQGYHYLSPPIQIDWDLSRIAFVAEIVPSRATDAGWFVYSIIPFERAKVYRGNFEYPFAFYDLDGHRNDVPDLLVRAVTNKAHDPYYLSGTAKEPTAMIRYSWKQLNRGSWDYSLNLLGRHSTLQSNVRLDEHLSLEIIPYDDYPAWVLDRTWDTITFVESIEGFPGLEGIYVWSGLNKVRDNYLTGYSDQPPIDDFSSIAQGFRGEYALGPALSPELYFSPVDRRLHLFGAQGGLWNLDGRNEIVYKGNEDGFINQWLLKDEYGFKERLFVLGNYVVFADGTSVEIYEKDVPSALFFAAPPKDQDAWQTLKNELSEHHQPLPPGDLSAMASQFGDPLVTLPSATASSFRSKADNFRFLLQLETPVSLPGDNILQKDSLDAGKYVVTFEETNRSLTVTQATPPDVSLELTTWENHKNDRSMAIGIRAINTGRQDATELTLTVNAQLNQRREAIHQASVDLFSQRPKMSVIDWLPLEEGKWELKASLVDSQGNTIAEDGDVVYVEEARFPGLNRPFTPARLSLIVLIILLPATIAYIVTDELDLTISGRKQNS